MIRQPTVLVLGAGASATYGFPLGEGLLRGVADDLKTFDAGTPGDLLLKVLDCSPGKLSDFRSDLLNARRRSIDAFIEARAAQYDLIGRTAIAGHLLRCEKEDGLFPVRSEKVPSQDWYTPFFDAILGTRAEAFRSNQLRVITFNFDRSFERAMFLALDANFPRETTVALLDAIPVLHMHGDLGGPTWLNSTDSPARPYMPTNDPSVVAAVADRLRIVHHEIPDATLGMAADWIRWATRVIFFGFSFHELNLKKLCVEQWAVGKTVHATRLGLGEGPKRRIDRLTGGSINWMHHEWSMVDCLNGHDWFYEG